MFNHLHKLTPHIDDAFQSFYDSMLSDVRLSVFFDNDEQISQLIKTQKNYFIKSLELTQDELKPIYIKLGEYHYDIRIPYVDFIKGTDILIEHFLYNTQRIESSLELMDEIFEYFKIMKAYTAKGYLNRMLSDDRKDIDSFCVNTNEDTDTYLPKKLIMEKVSWLKNLLSSIENDEHFEIDTTDIIFNRWLNELHFVSLEKRKFFEDMEKRIILNTQNLFYFLKREEYLEILPLYTSLLNVYKLTLMMNNAVTIEYANKIIEDMKLDSLTKLYRKDIFEEFLEKEIALTKRDEKHYFSVAYIDLDSFKNINDNYGHYSGDKVIEKMGDSIRNNIRASDIGFRIGGDEFAVIFKKATKSQAKNVCQKIKADFTSFEFLFTEEITFRVGMSVGVSDFLHSSNENLKEFLENVDKKLYNAKHQGKNQIII